jgi:hypothetical protein
MSGRVRLERIDRAREGGVRGDDTSVKDDGTVLMDGVDDRDSRQRAREPLTQDERKIGCSLRSRDGLIEERHVGVEGGIVRSRREYRARARGKYEGRGRRTSCIPEHSRQLRRIGSITSLAGEPGGR